MQERKGNHKAASAWGRGGDSRAACLVATGSRPCDRYGVRARGTMHTARAVAHCMALHAVLSHHGSAPRALVSEKLADAIGCQSQLTSTPPAPTPEAAAMASVAFRVALRAACSASGSADEPSSGCSNDGSEGTMKRPSLSSSACNARKEGQVGRRGGCEDKVGSGRGGRGEDTRERWREFGERVGRRLL